MNTKTTEVPWNLGRLLSIDTQRSEYIEAKYFSLNALSNNSTTAYKKKYITSNLYVVRNSIKQIYVFATYIASTYEAHMKHI